MEKIRTAAYCRVSTAKEEQEGSYEMQVKYFTEMIQNNPAMEFVGIYGDKGKSGLHMNGRPGLKKLMEDCRAGKIGLVLTKSISRFARSMPDCAAMIQELRQLGVNILFEKENLNSKDEKCTLILNIFSAIAQEESHSISLHSTWAHEQYILEGKPFGRISFGYRNAGGNRWEINEEEAPRVRKAFHMAEEGKKYREILDALDEMETGEYRWSQRRLKHMLTNPVYKGDYFSGSTVCLVPGRQIRNKGYRDRFYITGHHEPIVPPELFDSVQIMVGQGMLNSRMLRTRKDEERPGGGAQHAENGNQI